MAKTVDPHTKLYAYNQTEIRELGVCELMIQYQSRKKVCEFYVVDFPTAILGTNNSQHLRLNTVHFNSIDSEISQPEPVSMNDNLSIAMPMTINAIQNDDEFSIKIK